MYPYLSLFQLQIPMYWLCALAGVLAAVALIWWRNRQRRLATDDILHLAALGLVGAMVGAKLLYLLTILPQLLANWDLVNATPELLQTLFIQGSVFYGGLLGGLLAAWLYLRRYRLDQAAYADLLAPALPLFHAFARIGCFLVGCCYGLPCEHGIAFTQALGAPNGIPLLPIQLIEGGCNLLILAALLLTEKQRRKGSNLPFYLASYAVCRFVLEFWRGDAIRGFVGPLSTSQWISVLILAAVLYHCWRKRPRDGGRFAAKSKTAADSQQRNAIETKNNIDSDQSIL